MNRTKENIMKIIFLLSATISILSLLLIFIFIINGSKNAYIQIGLKDFILGTKWAPNNIPPSYGILPMILGSIYVTIGAIVFGVPIGVLTAVYFSFYCNDKLYKILKPCVNLLAGIPSIIYGFFGLIVLVPLVRKIFSTFEATGTGILTASLLLGIMILPIIITVSEEALKSVDKSFYEGAVALGASKDVAIRKVIIPSAKSGIIASIVLGIGRAMGETMAVIMVAGNQVRMPKGILKGVRTLTANIVIEMGYAAGIHRDALIFTGLILFIFILIINIMLMVFKKVTK